MLRINFSGEIKEVIKYEEKEVEGKNGPFTAYTIMFKLKTKRSYKINNEPVIDTVICFAHGQTAKYIKLLSPKHKYINGSGELVILNNTLVLEIYNPYLYKEPIELINNTDFIELN